jgi:hypothetical protein
LSTTISDTQPATERRFTAAVAAFQAGDPHAGLTAWTALTAKALQRRREIRWLRDTYDASGNPEALSRRVPRKRRAPIDREVRQQPGSNL